MLLQQLHVQAEASAPDQIDYAVWLTARETKDAWLPAVLDGTFAAGDVVEVEVAGSHLTFRKRPPGQRGAAA